MNSGSNKESNNNNYKFFYGLIFLVANILGFGLATEWVAYRLNYPAILGEPIFIWFDTPIYNPFSYINWILKYNDYAPIVFSQAMLPIVLSTFIAMGVVFICKMLKARSNDTPTTYGSARFANPKEIETSGLRNEKGGVVLGLDQKNQYLLHNGAEHIKVIAPTRSGKGVGLVIPTLLNWQHSVVVNDIKGELWRETSGWRKQFSYVIAFDPTHKATARFNPLFEVRLGDSEIKDVQNITSMIVDPEGKGKTDHWSKEADAYLVAVILHILYAEPNKTLAGVYSFINDPNRTLDQTLQIMLTTRHLGDKGVHPVVAMGARAMLNKSPNEKTGVHSSAKAFLSLYVDPIVAAATSESDFRIMDLQHLEKPVSLYLIFPPSDMERLKPLFRLILTQITARLTEAHNPTVDKQRLLLLLDEFPSLGKLAFFETALGYTAGYGIKAMLISQNYNQLIETYGKNNIIVDSCHVRVYFAPNTEDSAEIISRALGTKTEVRKQTNMSGGRFNLILGHVMVSSQESPRRLMTAGEVMVLPPTDEIIMVAGQYPIYAKKLYYYNDKELIRRAGFSAQVITDTRPYPYSCPTRENLWLDLPVKAAQPPILPSNIDSGNSESTETVPNQNINEVTTANISEISAANDEEDASNNFPFNEAAFEQQQQQQHQQQQQIIAAEDDFEYKPLTTF